MATLNKLVNKLGASNVKVVGVIIYPVKSQELANFKRECKLKYPVFASVELQGDYNTREYGMYPITLVGNKEGKIVLVEEGDKPEGDVIEEILNFFRRTIRAHEFKQQFYKNSIESINL